MNADSLQKAKNYAFLLLKYRPRSEKELASRLKQKKFDLETIQETVTFLREKAFLNDAAFTRGWIESRLKKPLGLRVIRRELLQKGIDRETISKGIAAAAEDYSEIDTVKRIARHRFAKSKHIEPLKAKQRIYAYLLRRGFSPDVVVEVVKEL